jgi:Domain of unknown function (DUF4397)
MSPVRCAATLTLVLAAAPGCSERGAGRTTRAPALLRIVNAAGGRAGITILADRSRLFDNVAAHQVTAYHRVPVDDVTLAVQSRGRGAAEPAHPYREDLEMGARYTAVILPDDEGRAVGIRVLRDALPADTTMPHLRVIHAARGAGPVDVTVPGDPDPLFRTVTFGDATGYRAIAPTAGTVEIRRGGQRARLVALSHLPLTPGVAWTVVLAGAPNQPMQAIALSDPRPAETGRMSLVP